GARLAAGLRAAVARHGLEDAHVTEDGSLVQLHFDVAGPPRTGAELNPGSERLGRFHLAALANGVYVAPRGELNVTTAMDAGLVDESVAALDAALGLLR
ncbi:MAG: hypothetical protein JWN32_3884, partial [Solirubrobacterales bacterium]|nr:hypothetical protein [Solirubrobacterales bacterium]